MITLNSEKKFSSTNELRNINIDNIINNKNMKAKKNPIHIDFIDDINDVFKKFIFNEKNYHGKSGHNFIFKNKNFILRISNQIFKTNDNDDSDEKNKTDNDIYINKDYKYKDEENLIKAVKKNLSPRVYYLGNILINTNIHRYAIIESYDTTLKTFIGKKLYLQILNSDNNYNNVEEILDDILYQIFCIIETLFNSNYIFYDIKPNNIVINFSKDQKINLKFIDWDSDFCIEEEWLLENDKNIKIIKFISLLIISFYSLVYLNNNIFYKYLEKLYDESDLELIYKIMLDDKNQYLIIILTYFYKSFEIKYYQISFYFKNINNNSIYDNMKNNILKMIKGS